MNLLCTFSNIRFWYVSNHAFRYSTYNYEDLRKIVMNYPYCKMPNKIYNATINIDQTQQKDFLADNLVNDAVAFGCLSTVGSLYLSSYYQKLFGKQYQEDKKIFGPQIFNKYFENRLESLKQSLHRKQNHEQKQYALKVLSYFTRSKQALSLIDINQFNLQQIMNDSQTTITQKAYILNIKINQNDYLSHINTFIQEFKACQNKQDKLNASLAIFLVEPLSQTVPEQLIKQCLRAFQEQIDNLNDWSLFQIFSSLFQVNKRDCQDFIQKITIHLTTMSKKNFKAVKIPVIMKLMSLRHQKKMGNTMIGQLIRSNPLKFNTIFFKKTTNKQIFLQVLKQACPLGKYSEETQIYFDKYMVEEYRNLAEQQKQVKVRQVIKLFKLSLKFYNNMSEHVQKQIAELIKIRIIQAFKESTDIYFWSVVYLFRTKQGQFHKQELIKPTRQLLLILDQRYRDCQQNAQGQFSRYSKKTELLEQIIDLHYQLARKKVNLNQCIKLLPNYDYNHIENPQKFIYVCYLMLKLQKLTKQSISKMFSEMEKKLQRNIENKNIYSVKHLFTIGNIMNKIEENSRQNQSQIGSTHKNFIYIWYKIQKLMVQQYSRNQRVLNQKDLAVLLKYINKYKNELKHFHELLSQSLDHPQNYKVNIQKYMKFAQKKSIKRK